MAEEAEGGTFWVRTLAKGVSTIGALLASITGIFVLISFSAKCIAMGIFMIGAGLVMLMLEATMCFMFLDIGKWIESKSDKIKSWQKMFFYFLLCIPAPAICSSTSSYIGSFGFLLAGMCYMVLTIGPKGTAPPQSAASVPYARQIDDISTA
ncbi:hypothetical protein ACHWQZ_G003150 [Mnemiopsis leidyi]